MSYSQENMQLKEGGFDMQRQIIKESVFGLYHQDGNELKFLGEHRVPGRKSTLTKADMKQLKKTIKDLNKIVFDRYETEMRYMSEEDFIKYSTTVAPNKEN